jgi:hypothetical protein
MHPPRWNFPLARRGWAFAKLAAANWRERHLHPASVALHAVGIPLALAGVCSLFVLPWAWGAGLVAGGYALQWAGHRVEGNDVGELVPLKRLIGLPVVVVAPRTARPAETPQP